MSLKMRFLVTSALHGWINSLNPDRADQAGHAPGQAEEDVCQLCLANTVVPLRWQATPTRAPAIGPPSPPGGSTPHCGSDATSSIGAPRVHLCRLSLSVARPSQAVCGDARSTDSLS